MTLWVFSIKPFYDLHWQIFRTPGYFWLKQGLRYFFLYFLIFITKKNYLFSVWCSFISLHWKVWIVFHLSVPKALICWLAGDTDGFKFAFSKPKQDHHYHMAEGSEKCKLSQITHNSTLKCHLLKLNIDYDRCFLFCQLQLLKWEETEVTRNKSMSLISLFCIYNSIDVWCINWSLKSLKVKDVKDCLRCWSCDGLENVWGNLKNVYIDAFYWSNSIVGKEVGQPFEQSVHHV